ncbi:MAG: 4-(cytidine 5'-diphospho)-2-C-methyl-D-erythritol kinase [Dehalococcoidia bacterium]|nr:4-(cytidine 5'-diphospho)-2-C-methyl-D-erythritol kinase [Dehalococcoidia bacterium]
MLTILAPAKLNLTLEVLARRPDGYHEIRSVIQTISLCDRLTFRARPSVDIRTDSPQWSAEKSLVSRAANLVRETIGVTRGIAIDVESRIPLISGLGGDSSAAAATLRGLNECWELNLPEEKLFELAVQLGSDVPFFLHGGTAVAQGRGEVVTPLPSLPRHWVVLVMPDVPRLPGKTAKLYASLNTSHFTDGRITKQLVKELKEGREPSTLFNTFENVALARGSELKVYRDHIRKLGAPHVHLAGSGPALFTLLKDKTQAEELYTRCKQQNMETYLVETLASDYSPTG